MDFEQIREQLPPSFAQAVDLPAAWRRYRSKDGAQDPASFLRWLSQQQEDGATLDPNATRNAETEVEISHCLPPRLESMETITAAMFDTEAATVISAPLSARTSQVTATAATSTPNAVTNDEFHYQLLSIAGKGGMGTVHVARDTELLRRVALKQLNPEVGNAAALKQRFLREVQITAQLDHPHIVPVYALELAPGGTPAYTMKLVEGRTFHALLNETRDAYDNEQKPDEAHSLSARIEHFLKVCDAIAYAHDKGVIHRDLKPANLMLGRHNEVYVMDWGLCRLLRHADEPAAETSRINASPDVSGSASETQLGDVIGTPKYMSPEQAQGRNRDLDARSDQFALGLILYELVTLQSPYDGRTAYDVLINAAAGKRRSVTAIYPGQRIPRELRAIIEHSTATSPDQRYANVADMAADLRRYLRGAAVHAKPDTLWQRMQRTIVRHRQGALIGLLTIIALSASSVGWLVWQNQRELEAAHQREHRILALRNALSHQAGAVQTRFLQLEGAVENLASSTEQILDYGIPGDARFYLLRDFHDVRNAPPDLIPSTIIDGKISLRFPVWTLPRGMNEKDALPTIRKLVALQSFRREIYRRSATLLESTDTDMYGAYSNQPDTEKNPIIAVVLGLNNGIGSRYPGWDGLSEDYDPRQRPWYQLAQGKFGPQWGTPYLSTISHRSELPLSVPLYNRDQHFVGVLSALLLPDLLVHALLNLKDIPSVRGMYLLDADGHVLAATDKSLLGTEPLPDQDSLQQFPLPELLKQIKRGETGILETKALGQSDIIAFDNVEPLGWSLVVVADANQLLQE